MSTPLIGLHSQAPIKLQIQVRHCVDHAPLRGHTGTIPGARKHRSDGVESLAFGRTLKCSGQHSFQVDAKGNVW